MSSMVLAYRASPEVAEVFVMAACPFPMAVSSASLVEEAEMKLEALIVDEMLTVMKTSKKHLNLQYRIP